MAAKTVLLIAGEASGDLHAGAFARELLREGGLRVTGIGGPEMAAAGVRLLHTLDEFQVMGFVEVARKLPFFRRALAEIRSLFRTDPPDLFVPVDYPGFNLRLLPDATRAGVPVLYYVSPQIWAWDPGRIRVLARHVRKMAVVFPFETPLYERAGVDVTFVGHPLLERLPAPAAPPDGPAPGLTLGLLPGSRPEEVRHHLPLLLETARLLARPGLSFLVSAASGLPAGTVEEHVRAWRAGTPGLPGIEIARGTARETLGRSDLALVASGTATLEAALLGVPMVVYYRTAPLNYWIARRLVRVPHIGLVNLVAGERLVPELVQGGATPAHLAREALRYLDDPAHRARIRGALLGLRTRLGTPGASARTAALARAILAEGR